MMHLYFGRSEWIKQAVFSLRKSVFVDEQGISPQLEFDTNDQFCNYFLLTDNATPVATIRYQSLDSQTVQPDRLCVAKNYRRQGIGQQLLGVYEKQAVADGFYHSQLSAEVSAEGFYQKCGYQTISAPFIEDGILCLTMEKKLR
jgi:predicted GNAT family N-acyltransferase